MPERLPERPSLSWLRKRAKAERANGSKLAAAQLVVARRYGRVYTPVRKAYTGQQ